MSATSVLNALRITYPVIVFLAVLASAGMTFVHAGTTGLFQNKNNNPFKSQILWTEIRTCSLSGQSPSTDQNLSCSSKENPTEWISRTNDDSRFATRRNPNLRA